MENKSTAKGGIGIVGLLQVAFIVLKLCKVIDWKWMWVLSPMWIGAGISVILIVLFVVAIKKNWF